MTIGKLVLNKFSYNDIFIETGTNNGDGVQTAIDVGFKKIYSIEFYSHKVKKAKNRFINNTNVKIIEGDSGNILQKVLSNIDVPVTFWLDSHFSYDTSASIPLADTCPILKELDIISKHKIKTHTLLIDDKRIFDKGISQWNNITTTNIIKAIKKINSNYNIYYVNGFIKNDIIVAEALR